jgi:fatty acid amide hydrolase
MGPLQGVPVTIKESLDLAGAPSTFGIPSRAGHRAGSDERHVARIREAGAIVLGKTNVAQLLFYYESDNPLHGRTCNPWALDRTPGGSSGGEAAIIAAGGSAMGLGTDIGGSLRIPAAFCGIASIKPTSGRAPDLGRHSIPVGQQAIPSQVGVLARHVEDLGLGLEVINGGRAPEVEPPMPLGDFRGVDLKKLRVAWYTDDGTFATGPAVQRAVREAAGILRDAGARVTQWAPPDAALGMDMLYGIFGADGGELMRQMLGSDRRAPQIAQLMRGLPLRRGVIRVMQGVLRMMGQRGMADGLRTFGRQGAAHYWRLVEMQMEYRERFRDALDGADGGPFDLIIAPVSPLPAWTHGSSRELVTGGAYACLYNTLGYPAGVVPVTRVGEDEQVWRAPSRDIIVKTASRVEAGSAGLPIGVQVIARPWREHVALAAMSAIEGVARTRAGYPDTPVEVRTA